MNFEKLLAKHGLKKHNCNPFKSSSSSSIRAFVCICWAYLYLLLILSLPNVKGKFRPDFQISFSNILKNKKYHVKVQAGSFHLNGHIVGFRPQTQKLQSPFKTPSSTLAVKGLTFWAVVFKVLSIWWQFPPFEFRSISWHSFFWGPCVVVIFENVPFSI